MTAEHELWEEFIYMLGTSIDLKFDKGGFTSKCNSWSRPHATKILEELGADVPSSMAYFEKHGGFCDCEILVNCAINEHKRIRETGIP